MSPEIWLIVHWGSTESFSPRCLPGWGLPPPAEPVEKPTIESLERSTWSKLGVARPVPCQAELIEENVMMLTLLIC